MSLAWMFTLELLLVAVLLAGFASGAIYFWVADRGQGEGRRTARTRSGSVPALRLARQRGSSSKDEPRDERGDESASVLHRGA